MSTLAPDRGRTAERYRLWGLRDARGLSPSYEALALAVADDEDVLALIDTLPVRQRLPTIVFAASRILGAPVSDPRAWREWFLGSFDELAPIAASRTTQTNEAARCALYLPALTGIDGPIALLELGASAGLCLYPDRYSYRYATPDGVVSLDPPDGRSAVVLECEALGPVPFPRRPPEIVWRAGIDLNPLDVRSPDDLAWLEALIFPEHDDRRSRLRAAAAIVAEEPPRLFRGDIMELLKPVAAQAPPDATLVVVHTVAVSYLPKPDRARFLERVRELPGHWVSDEPQTAFAGIPLADPGDFAELGTLTSDFALLLDGRQVAFAQPHGRALRWLRPPE